MRKVPRWNEWFLLLADTVALRSKDPSTQVGCIIADPRTKAIRSVGYNGMVFGVVERDEMWERPVKYAYVCHAEANALALAARHSGGANGCTAYVSCFPCLACARLLIQSGIRRVVWPYGEVSGGHYGHELEATRTLLVKAGVDLVPVVVSGKSDLAKIEYRAQNGYMVIKIRPVSKFVLAAMLLSIPVLLLVFRTIALVLF